MEHIIIRFEGPWDCLSNSHPSPIALDGMVYPTVENAFQAAKTFDTGKRDLFTKCAPIYANKMGRSLVLRSDWTRVKKDIMEELLRKKFVPGSKLAERLLSTEGAYLCEGNTQHDNYWGACFCDRCLYTIHENTLGLLLMQVREELKE